MNETTTTEKDGVGAEGEVESANTEFTSVVGSQVGLSGVINDIIIIEAEFERAVIADAKNRERNRENWNIYSGLNYGQYTAQDVAQAVQEGRHLDTFNLARQKVDSLVGALLRNPYEPDWIPTQGTLSEGTKAVKGAWNCDKNLFGFESFNREMSIDAMVYQGVAEMYISRNWDPDLGNVAMRRLSPGMVVFDPHWRTPSSKDCTKAWKVSYLTPRQIKSLFPKFKGNRVDGEVALNRIRGDYYNDQRAESVTPDFDLVDYSGTDRYRVISRYEIVEEEYWCEVDTMTGLELPVTDDLAVKIAFLNRTNDAWDAYKINKRKRTRKVCYVTTICPQLTRNEVLEHKTTEVQIGRLPFFPLSAARINGVACGIVDLIKDVQRVLNYRENLLTFMIETSANGAQLGDPMMFGGDKKEMDDFVSRKNQPNAFKWTANGAIMKGNGNGIINVRKPEMANDVLNQLMRMWDVADRISKAPAVSDARTEGQGESGYLYAQKTRIAEQQQYILFSQVKQWLADIAEGYFEQAKIQYSIGMFEREFVIDDGENSVVFNKKVKLPNGQTGIANDISALPRHRVVISESPAGLTNRLTTRALDTELLKIMPPENIGTRQILTSELMDTMDHNTKETKVKLKMVRELEEQQAVLTLEANVLKLETNNLQAMEQLEMLKMQSMAKKLMKEGVDPELILKTTGVDPRPQPNPMPGQPGQPPIPAATPQQMGAPA